MTPDKMARRLNRIAAAIDLDPHPSKRYYLAALDYTHIDESGRPAPEFPFVRMRNTEISTKNVPIADLTTIWKEDPSGTTYDVKIVGEDEYHEGMINDDFEDFVRENRGAKVDVVKHIPEQAEMYLTLPGIRDAILEDPITTPYAILFSPTRVEDESDLEPMTFHNKKEFENFLLEYMDRTGVHTSH